MNTKLAKRIQSKLKELGFYKGKIDGIFGNRSKIALMKFQKLHPPLIPDGIYGQMTEAVLFIDDIDDRVEIKKSKQGEISGIPHESEIERFYGRPGENIVKISLPYTMRLAWDESKKVKKMSVNKKIAENVEHMFVDILKEFGRDGIKLMGLNLFGGSYNKRKIRGGNRWSTHAYGIAIDLDPAHNQLRWHTPKARFSRKEYKPFWDIVKKHKGYSLGLAKDYDWMHIQWCYR